MTKDTFIAPSLKKFKGSFVSELCVRNGGQEQIDISY